RIGTDFNHGSRSRGTDEHGLGGFPKIPTGFSPPAQGCEERATLGEGVGKDCKPQRGFARFLTCHNRYRRSIFIWYFQPKRDALFCETKSCERNCTPSSEAFRKTWNALRS